MKKLLHNYPLLVVLLIGSIILLSHLSNLPTNIMEARNFVTAREMVTHDNWFLTTLNELPRYEKPPLPTWITAVFGYLFGFEDLFFLRLPVVITTLFMLFWFFKLNEALKFTKTQALQNSLILISSFYVFFSGRDNNWDMYTHSFMIGSIYHWVKYTQEFKKYYHFFIACLLFGFSFLSKGPVSFYALLLPFLLSFYFIYKPKGKNSLSLLLYFLIGLAIGISWYAYVRLIDPDSFIKVADVESSRWGNYNVRPFYYYWSFFIQSGLWTIPALLSLFYPYLKNKVSNKKLYTFSFVWTVAAILLLSIIPEKKSRYLLPALIPLAINTGFIIEYLTHKKITTTKIDFLFSKYIFLFYALLALILPIAFYFVAKSHIQEVLLFYILFTISSLLVAWIIFHKINTKQYEFLLFPVIGIQIIVLVFGLPLLNPMSSRNNFKKSVSEIHSIEKAYKIKTYNTNTDPEILFYYGNSLPAIKVDRLDNNNLEFPIGLIVPIEDVELNNKKLHFKKITRLDFNEGLDGLKKPNSRLLKDYYLVTKKDDE